MREQPGPPGAPVLMLLHGWSATADLNWHHCFGPLAKQFRVLAIDHRGHGRGLRHTGPFTLEDCADDVAALAAQLGIERLIAVGYSMGGPIAQLLWQRHRSLVDGLVLCSTSAVFGSTARLRALFRVAAGLSAARATGTVSSLASSALGAVSRWNGRGGEVPWARRAVGASRLEASHRGRSPDRPLRREGVDRFGVSADGCRGHDG